MRLHCSRTTSNNVIGPSSANTLMAVTSVPQLAIAATLDNAIREKCIVDTSASISLLPPRFCTPLLQPIHVLLTNAIGSPIKVYGELTYDLVIPCLRSSYTWTFIVAGVTNPILGADFQSQNDFVVDSGRNFLIDKK